MEHLEVIKKLLLVLFVYCGFYLVITTLRYTTENIIGNLYNYYGFNLMLAVISVFFIPFIAGAITFQIILAIIKKGWEVVVIVVAFSTGIGAILALYNQGSVFVLAFATPGVLLIMNPARLPIWADQALDIKEDARLLTALGIIAALAAVYVDIITSYYYTITILIFSMMIIATGTFTTIKMVIPAVSEPISRTTKKETVRYFEAPITHQASAIMNVFSWNIVIVVVVFFLRGFAAFSSFNTNIGKFESGWIQIASLFAGIGIATLFLIICRNVRKKFAFVTMIAFIILFGFFIAYIFIRNSFTVDFEIVYRIAVNLSLPTVLAGIYTASIDDLKAKFLEFLNMTCLMFISLLFILGLSILDDKNPLMKDIFNFVFFIAFALAGISLLINLFNEARIRVKGINIVPPTNNVQAKGGARQ